MDYNSNPQAQRRKLVRLAQVVCVRTDVKTRGKTSPVPNNTLRARIFEAAFGKSWGKVTGYRDAAEFDQALERAVDTSLGVHGGVLMEAQLLIRAGMNAKDEATKLHKTDRRNLPEALQRLAQARTYFARANAAQDRHEEAVRHGK